MTLKHTNAQFLDNKKDVFSEKIDLQKKLELQSKTDWGKFRQKSPLRPFQRDMIRKANRQFQNETLLHFRAI